MDKDNDESIYDENGKFIPYSTTILYESEHKLLTRHRKGIKKETEYRKTLPYDAMGDYSDWWSYKDSYDNNS